MAGKFTRKYLVKVTAKKAGKNVSKTLAAKVTVKPVVIKAKTKVMGLALNETAKLDLAIAPKGKKVNYKSSNEAIVKVVSDGAIQAVGYGTATVTVSSKYAQNPAEVTVHVAKEGLTAYLSNPMSDKYPNSVLVNNQAVINVKFVKDGKPVAGEAIVITINGKSGAGKDHYELKNHTAVTTNANGEAVFVIGNIGNNVKSSATGEVAEISYRATVASSKEYVDGNVTFGAVYMTGVDNVNNNTPRPTGFNALAVSTNDKNGATKGDGATYTTSTITQGNPGARVEYVDSQQVSSGSTDHKVGFDGSIPMLTIPGTSTDLEAAKNFTQELNWESGKYYTYASKSDSKIVKVDAVPSELTYATMNFTDLKLSAYTRLVIETFTSEADANKKNTAGDSTRDSNGKLVNGAIDQKFIDGEANMSTFSYQIPLDPYAAGLWVRVTLLSQGQVNVGMNDGYKLKDIIGVYRTQETVKGVNVALQGAEVKWEAVTAPMSEIQVLTSGAITAIKRYSGVDFTATNTDKIVNVTYQVPVFPYTGNAVLTCYDAAGKVVAYYVCPTKNNGNNVNVLDTTANYVYKVSKEEAFNNVGTVTQDGNRVIVDSQKVGHTTLKGTLTLNGEKFEGLDETNKYSYTSVQWCPIPTQNVGAKGFVALIGQDINVIAQLTDKNDNPVSTQGVGISFHDGNDAQIAKGTVISGDKKVVPSTGKVSVVDVARETDANGQAKLVLKAADVVTLLNITAKASNNAYNVKLYVGEVVADNEAPKADLYWVDADLSFTDSVQKMDTVKTSAATPIVTSGALKIEPKTGTNWEYGVQTFSNKLVGGVLNGSSVSITGLPVKMSKSADSVGTIAPVTDRTGTVTATSTKAGNTKITATLNATVADNVKFVIAGAEKKGVGTGKATLSKKLTLVVDWKNNGITADIFTANGNYATTGSSINVYVKVVDVNGNPYKGAEKKNITFTVDKIGILTPAAAVSCGAIRGNVTTNSDAYQLTVEPNDDGIAAITLTNNHATPLNTVVSATVDSISDAAYATTIHWGAPVDFSLNDDVTIDGDVYNSRIAEDGTVILTFNDNINAESVKADQFKVKIGSDTYDMSVVSVSENVIVLKVMNGPVSIPFDSPYEVIYKSVRTKEGILYALTSENGVVKADKTTFTLRKGATPVNGGAKPAESVRP